MVPIDLAKLQTEARNPRSADIDSLPAVEICRIINKEDANVSQAVARCLPKVAAAVDTLAERVRKGGRVIYVGAGTSGRLGVLDASEIPPTYSAPPSQFVGLIAGGDAAIRRSQEGSEDSEESGIADLQRLELNGNLDSVIGIAASGRTPYVLGCLQYAKGLGCTTIGVVCCSPSAISQSGYVDYMIEAVTGPEVVTGSTRMKAGTATKMVLNMLSTAVMIKVGKTFGNMMIDVKPSNAKLRQRARGIIRDLAGNRVPESDEDIDALLARCKGSVKLALTVLHLSVGIEEAQSRLNANGGILSRTLAEVRMTKPVASHIDINLKKPRYVLCVDGGGTKCLAVVRSSHGEVSEAEAGPCNVTTIGVEAAVATIISATRRALSKLTRGLPAGKINLHSIRFAAIWIGLAGLDRASVRPRIEAALSQAFNIEPSSMFRVTNDLDLVASASMYRPRIKSAVVLVAGTGSVAMLYRVDTGSVVNTGRAGGWGHLLGDDGSGYDLGRQAIRHTLGVLDRLRSSHVADPKDGLLDLGSLELKVLEHFRLGGEHLADADLLSAVLVNAGPSIAGVARAVLSCYSDDEFARDIVNSGAASLAQIVQRVAGPQGMEQNSSVLLLAGGLFRDLQYRNTVLSKLKAVGISPTAVEYVEHPARTTPQYLAQQYLAKKRLYVSCSKL